MGVDRATIDEAVAGLIGFLETGSVPTGLFSADVFSDVSLPRWRLQSDTAEGIAEIRRSNHPCAGEVTVERVDRLPNGFCIAFEERWTDDQSSWYSRELIRADVTDRGIVDLAVYCTGDWDDQRRQEHAEAVQLIRS